MADEWVPLTGLVVKYPKDDLLGKYLAISSLIPFAIITAYITLCLMVRDIRIIFMFIGQLIDEFMCLFIKNIIKQPRPRGHDQIYLKIYGKPDLGYGMPSQHAQFQAFFTVFAILYLSNLKSKKAYRTFFCFLKLFLIASCFIISYSRVYLVYHYWSQVFAGLVVGSLWGYVWFQISQLVFERHLYKKIMDCKIAKCLHLTYDANLFKVNGD